MASPSLPMPTAFARLQLLYQLAGAFCAQIELDELIPSIVEKCSELLASEGASLLLLDRKNDELYFPVGVARDRDVAARLQTLRFPADLGIAGEVVRTGEPTLVADTSTHPKFYREIDRATGVTTRRLITAPLKTHQGTIGVLQIVNPSTDKGTAVHDLSFVSALAGSIAIALENAQLYAQLKESEQTLRTEVRALRRDIARRDRFDEIIGTSSAMSEVFRLMESAADSTISVLIQGETGTGKEMVARGLHRASDRATGPFIAVNCAAVVESLLESELFGHKRGSFTGALSDRRGLFEAANGGTIFLDEVGDMPIVMQAKLLRVLQEGEIVAVGETRPRKVDVRVISATNRDLAEEVGKRTFREDLFYRLAQFPIRLPPLRERRSDIPLIAGAMLGAAARRQRKQIPGFDPDALTALQEHPWPGNVRQLQNEIERAVALARSGESLEMRHLSIASTSQRAMPVPLADPLPAVETSPEHASNGARRQEAGIASRHQTSLREARDRFEKDFIVETLRRESGNISRTAQLVGLSRGMLQRKMRDFGLR